MMWGAIAAIAAGIAFMLTTVFSLAKASSSADRMAEKHREELLSRKHVQISASAEKPAEKSKESFDSVDKN